MSGRNPLSDPHRLVGELRPMVATVAQARAVLDELNELDPFDEEEWERSGQAEATHLLQVIKWEAGEVGGAGYLTDLGRETIRARWGM